MELNMRNMYFQARKSSGRLIIHLEPGQVVSDLLLYLVVTLVYLFDEKMWYFAVFIVNMICQQIKRKLVLLFKFSSG